MTKEFDENEKEENPWELEIGNDDELIKGINSFLKDKEKESAFNKNEEKKNNFLKDKFVIAWPKFKIKEGKKTFILKDFLKTQDFCVFKNNAYQNETFYHFIIHSDVDHLFLDGNQQKFVDYQDVYELWLKWCDKIKKENFADYEIEIKTVAGLKRANELIQWMDVREFIIKNENLNARKETTKISDIDIADFDIKNK